ncbi:MAG: methionine aminopeptidase [Candidatus Phytoplasma cynodontis]|uniref:type I methionyl aminopeptidase n=1 Tax='Cynodon dactylon' phytoplasma TaxID=295320 RepID=UPI001265C834|nr:type I methionyl aminopeptidase ['Cynodon dactylon' phytoplasma]KAB8121966.1 type I methionyl aminopeptidase ['Cynodon dactylon' phytoplasma]WIA07620.1 MAG: methionine aminopeptidase [Candidatus Phytoplasma cynodontis]
MIFKKTNQEIVIMREAGKILSIIREELSTYLKPNLSTLELDIIANSLMKKYNVVSAFKGYKNFSGYTCISVNEIIVHGVPSKQRILKLGDIVTLDIGIKFQDYYVDSAWTYYLGDTSTNNKKLIKNTLKALYEGIKKVKPGNYISDISLAIEKIGKINNYGIVEVFSGHGIGSSLHEAPNIFNFDFTKENCLKDKDYVLEKGMTFCIEPMFTLGSKEIKILSDGWSASTIDSSLSAHFEHTVLVTDKGYEILT